MYIESVGRIFLLLVFDCISFLFYVLRNQFVIHEKLFVDNFLFLSFECAAICASCTEGICTKKMQFISESCKSECKCHCKGFCLIFLLKILSCEIDCHDCKGICKLYKKKNHELKLCCNFSNVINRNLSFINRTLIF